MKLTRQVRIYILVGSILVFILLYFLILISPALQRQQRLEQAILKKTSELDRSRAMMVEWQVFDRNRSDAEEKLRKRGKAFTLLSYLEQVSRKKGINSKIQYMKPLSFPDEEGAMRPEGIEIRFEGILLNELELFLQAIEYSNRLLRIKRIKILKRAAGKGGQLDVTLQVHTYVLAA
jgi:hypothetical protein